MLRIFIIYLFTALPFMVSAQQLSPQKSNGKWGFTDATNTMVIKPKWDNASVFSDGLAAVQKKGKWGFVDASGKLIIKPKFDEVGKFSEDKVAVKIANKWGYISKTGDLQLPFTFEKAMPFKNGEAQVVVEGLLPRQSIVIDPLGKQIAPPHLFRKEIETNVYFIVSQKKNKDSIFCYVDDEGTMLSDWYLNRFSLSQIPQKVITTASMSDDQVPGDILLDDTKKVLYGFINDKGALVSEWYEEVMPFRDGFAPTKKNHRFGFIDSAFANVVTYKYLEIRVFDDAHYVAQTKNQGFVLLDNNGNVIGKEYSGYDSFNDQRIVGYSLEDFMGTKTYKKALFTLDGKQQSGWYNEIYPASNHYHRVLDEKMMVGKDKKVSFQKIYNYIIDSTGEVLSDWRPCFETSFEFSESQLKDSVLKFSHQSATNYFIEETFFKDQFFKEHQVDFTSQKILFEGGDFHDGMSVIAQAKSGSKSKKIVKGVTFESDDVLYGFIDWNGDQRIACRYEYVSGFSDGKAIFRENGKFGAIDYKGKVVLTAKYSLLGNFGSGIAPCYADSAWGYISTSGKMSLKPIYEEAFPHRYGYAAVKKDNKWGMIDTQGNVILPFKYRKAPMAMSTHTAKVLVDGIGYEVVDF